MAEIFTWWGGQTIGTRLSTWRRGTRVGEDSFGNVYYQSDGGKKRWVIYKEDADASRVPADWHGWLHKTFDEAPTDQPLEHKPWEKPHLANQTGTGLEYRPAGSIMRPAASAPSDYEAWTPE